MIGTGIFLRKSAVMFSLTGEIAKCSDEMLAFDSACPMFFKRAMQVSVARLDKREGAYFFLKKRL